MPRQRDYHAEYERRAAKARAQGTTYARIKYRQDKERARREGYPSIAARNKGRVSERIRGERIADISKQIGASFEGMPSGPDFDQMIRDLIGDREMEHDAEWWNAFRAWYARVSA